MPRLKLFFAVVLLLLALPFWRFVDILIILTPIEVLVSFTFMIWFTVFVVIPTKLIFTRIKTPLLLLGLTLYCFLMLRSSSLSKAVTSEPVLNHCGALTYTGIFYPARRILTDAHKDDLEARNQMCWLKKIISQIPSNFVFPSYSKNIHELLLKPQRKYRVSLPLIAYLFLKINLKASDSHPKNAYDSIRFWTDQYTEEIHHRDYPLWNWPHSSYIKWEYHWIEENWQKLIDEIVLTPK